MKTGKIFIPLVVTVMFILGLSNAQAQTRISIGTGGTGGVYFPMGGGVAEVFNKYLKGVTARAEVTGASTENARLVGANQQQIALANADTAYYAYHGQREFKKPLDILSMFSMYPSNMQIVCLKDSPINSIADLKGKRVAVGPPGGNTFVLTWVILKAHGFTEKDIKPVYQTFVESVDSIRDGNIDAVFILAGYPNSAVLDLANTRSIKLIPTADSMIKKIFEEYKFYTGSPIPAGTYKGVDQPIQSVVIMNIWIVNKTLPDDLVYRMVKAIFDHKDFLVSVHTKAADMNLRDAVQVPCPMHPGAIRYFKEVGALK
ncbi:MAG: TAXI family TRAP transporter solute-binding subunit [Candidatus Latescibacterota bacterium]